MVKSEKGMAVNRRSLWQNWT